MLATRQRRCAGAADLTTRVAEFNDLASVEAALAHGDVAAILTEPALTNIGIVLPEPGFMAGLRARHAVRRAADDRRDAHHLGRPGRRDPLWDLQPDIFVIGKSIGGGIPSGAYGIRRGGAARRLRAHPEADLVDVGGVGGTLPATRYRSRRCARLSSTC